MDGGAPMSKMRMRNRTNKTGLHLGNRKRRPSNDQVHLHDLQPAGEANERQGRSEMSRISDLNAEARIQAAIVEYVRTVAPHIMIYAVPNGGLRTRREAARLKWTGVLAGVLDLVVLLPGGRCAHWETKKPDGRLSEDQDIMIDWLARNDHTWAVVRSIDDARRELLRLGVVTREAGGSPSAETVRKNGLALFRETFRRLGVDPDKVFVPVEPESGT
jgi:hypothetical protein